MNAFVNIIIIYQESRLTSIESAKDNLVLLRIHLVTFATYLVVPKSVCRNKNQSWNRQKGFKGDESYGFGTSIFAHSHFCVVPIIMNLVP